MSDHARPEAQRPRILITGVTGGIGRHLAEHLKSAGAVVYGLQRRPPSAQSPAVIDEKHIYVGDLLDTNSLCETLDAVCPTEIYHLAGAIDNDTDEGYINYETNVTGTIRLLNAIRNVGLTPKILLASSSAVYGRSVKIPIKEESELCPLTHYAVSKVAQEMVAIQYHYTGGLSIVRARTFNVIGPGLSPSLLCSGLARQIAYSEKNGKRSIQVGNIQPHRDYTDVRDVVRAYELLMRSGKPGDVYNVSSMTSHSVKECLDVLLAKSKVPLVVEIDKSRYRSAEIEIQVGDASKISKLIGWGPKIPFEQSLEDSLNNWRQVLQEGS